MNFNKLMLDQETTETFPEFGVREYVDKIRSIHAQNMPLFEEFVVPKLSKMKKDLNKFFNNDVIFFENSFPIYFIAKGIPFKLTAKLDFIILLGFFDKNDDISHLKEAQQDKIFFTKPDNLPRFIIKNLDTLERINISISNKYLRKDGYTYKIHVSKIKELRF